MPIEHFRSREACPGCGSPRRRTLYAQPYDQPPISDYLRSFYKRLGDDAFTLLAGVSFTLDQCQDCSLIFQVEIPDNFLLKKLYEEWIDPHQGTTHHVKSFDFTRQYLQETMLFVKLLDKPAPEIRALDFGMGWGHWCKVVQGFGCQVWGYELSQPQIEHARSLGIGVVGWDDIPQGRFDFISTEQVFEHLDEPLKTLQQLRRGLTPQGLLKIATPNGSDIPGKLKCPDWKATKYSHNSLNKVSPLEHLNSFNPRAIMAMAAKVGLEPVRIPLSLHYASLVYWKPWKPMLKNAILPLYRKFHPRGTYFLFRPINT
jgi:2-polyprenyl-3-methyl-5-hydroxy-6-metoxy-1,4-benzoquinol methylase